MHPTITQLIAAAPVVTDGAWGTQLQQRGLAPGDCPDAWNLTQPAAVEAVAASYVAAGSRVILTNTFGANRIRLARHGLADKVSEINRAGVEISVRAARGKAAEGGMLGDKQIGRSPPVGQSDARSVLPSRPLVFASMGPSGLVLAMAETSAAELQDVFREQAAAIGDGGADGIVVETMSDLSEAALALAAARETGLPVVVCMTFDSGRQEGPHDDGRHARAGRRAADRRRGRRGGRNCGHGIAGHGRSLPPHARGNRPADLDQGQRRPAARSSRGR